MNLPKSVTVDPLSGEIEPGIAPLVEAMRRHGFNTVSSCEGHFRPNDFRHARLNVIFNALDRGLLHAWIRAWSYYAGEALRPVEFFMFPIWDWDLDVVHENNWSIEIHLSLCQTPEEAVARRDITVTGLVRSLEEGACNRPLAVDSFVRSRW
ncbi:MAG: hypothetical protein IH953_08370 [Chloroflexi bacterium]|nr:hypothetical protein [Chloroflexota bacterium]